MRIPHLELRDFRAYASAQVALDEPLCIIRGRNHSGKSTLKQAIQLSLTKCTDGTNAKGDGAGDKVRFGAKQAIIDLTIETKQGAIDIKTTYGNGRTQTLSVPAFERFIEANVSRLASVLDSEFFIMQEPEKQKAILAALIVPTSHEFDPELTALAEKHLGSFDWTRSPVGIIDSVYDQAFSARRDAKATLAAIRIPDKPKTVPEYAAEAINEHLSKLREKLVQCSVPQQPTSDGREIGRLEAEIAAKETTLKQVTSDRADAQAGVKELDGEIVSAATITKHKKVAANRDRFDQLELQIVEQGNVISTEQRAQAMYCELEGNAHCPTCTQVITADFIKQMVAQHEKNIEFAMERQREIRDQQKSLGDITGSESVIAQQDKHVARKLDLVREVTAGGEKIQQLGKEIVDLNAKLAKAKEATVAQTIEGPSPEALELSSKIEMWTQRLNESVQYATTVGQLETETARHREQSLKVQELEKLVAEFGKDGIKAKLINDNINEFEGTVNSVLRVWGYEAALSIEPYKFTVNTADGKSLPLKELSGSERLMFGVALQTAIAIHANIRMVVIDKADTFINGERGRLFECLRTLLSDGRLHQAIVLVADDRIEVPNQPGVAFFRVDDGKVQRLGRAQKQERAA